MNEYIHLRRLYVSQPLSEGAAVLFEDNPHHYIRNVMRMEPGEQLRLFNGQDGEWLATLQEVGKKKSIAAATQQLKAFASPKQQHVFCPALHKDRFDWVVQKATEMGMTKLHTIKTKRSDQKPIKRERIIAQMTEASEQCERLDVPVLAEQQAMIEAVTAFTGTIYAAVERVEAAPILPALQQRPLDKEIGFLMGPAGGFSDKEKDWLAAQGNVVPVSLGQNILRAETAITFMLSVYDAVLQDI